jgi:hypothetical protein
MLQERKTDESYFAFQQKVVIAIMINEIPTKHCPKKPVMPFFPCHSLIHMFATTYQPLLVWHKDYMYELTTLMTGYHTTSLRKRSKRLSSLNSTIKQHISQYHWCFPK